MRHSETLPDHPDRWAWLVEEHFRFCDTDQMGHASNVAYAAWAESGRMQLFADMGFDPVAATGEKTGPILARLEIDYHAELHFPARLQVGGLIARIGNSSMTITGGVFGDGCLRAVARSVVVKIGYDSRRPVALTPRERAFLEARLAPDL